MTAVANIKCDSMMPHARRWGPEDVGNMKL
jgi:hypothetical protein